ncbi:MAG: hypothetical protein AAF533_04805 [Acidobacteriota bacterium]
MDLTRRIDLEEASKLAGRTIRTLRKHVKDGRLEVADDSDPGDPVLTVGALASAGLLRDAKVLNPPAITPATPVVAFDELSEMLQNLAEERERATAAAAERVEGLYREVVDDQKTRIGRLEDENRELTNQLHEALRRVPKLLELEAVEAAASEAEKDRAEAERTATDAKVIAERESRRADDLSHQLGRAEERIGELEQKVEKLRKRGLWDRMVDREPRA